MSWTMRSGVSPARKPDDPAPAAEEIARVAYELFERRGSVQEDWCEAERRIRERRRRREA